MKQIILSLLFCLLSIQGFSEEKFNRIKNHFIIEDMVMVANTSANFFPYLNNELSVNCGLFNWFSIGIFYDLEKRTLKKTNNNFLKDKNLLGLKGSISFIPILGNELSNKNISRWDIGLNANFSYKRERFSTEISEKKDNQLWVNYYRLYGKYYLNQKIFISTSVGVLNSDRLFIGIGIKL
jgi:hypothetical protein